MLRAWTRSHGRWSERRVDNYFPVETAQQPISRMLGTPATDKKMLPTPRGRAPRRHPAARSTNRKDWMAASAGEKSLTAKPQETSDLCQTGQARVGRTRHRVDVSLAHLPNLCRKARVRAGIYDAFNPRIEPAVMHDSVAAVAGRK